MTAPLTKPQATVGGAVEPMPTRLRVLTGASAIVAAAHRSRDGVMHGHTWRIKAWWQGTPDAVSKQTELRNYLSRFDHSVLPDELAWGEAFGAMILQDLGCVKVEIDRPLEGIFAVIEHTPKAPRND